MNGALGESLPGFFVKSNTLSYKSANSFILVKHFVLVRAENIKERVGIFLPIQNILS